jgi:hypothetical protein
MSDEMERAREWWVLSRPKFLHVAARRTCLDEVAMLAAYAREREQWVSVEVRQPESVGKYITASTCFRDETRGTSVGELYWDGLGWIEPRNNLNVAVFGERVTHWRELPEAPQP